MGRNRLEFYFDCGSPWSYLAFEQVQPLAAELDVDLTFKPVLVGGIFNAVNTTVYESRRRSDSPKVRHAAKDMRDWVALTGLRLNTPPSVFPVNSTKVMRACLALQPEGKLVDFARAAFQAYWGDDRDISRPEVVGDLCRQVGADASAILERIETSEAKAALRALTDEAIARGAFGVPTYFLNGDDMYFGVDRLAMLRAALEGRLRRQSA